MNTIDVNDTGSNDQGCKIFGFTSTLNSILIPPVMSMQVAISLAKQGFKTLLLDLNITQPILALLFDNSVFFKSTTSLIFEAKPNFVSIVSEAYTQEFQSKGLLTVIPASVNIQSRLKFLDSPDNNLKNNLIKLLNFSKSIKENYDFMVLNMPASSDIKQLTGACLICDNNYLLISQDSISITYGLDLITNLEAVHPLIEFKGLVLYDYKYNVNFIDDERIFLEEMFNLPIIATLPSLPERIVDQELFTEDSKVANYFKILSQELFKFIHQPIVFSSTQQIIEVLIVANHSGIPLFTSYLKGNQSGSTIISHDEILASATLTAVVTGITEIIKEITLDLSGETKLIKQKHLSLIIEYDNPLRIMMLTQRSEDMMRNKVLMFLKLFKQKYKREIENFIGVTKDFVSAQTLVEEVF